MTHSLLYHITPWQPNSYITLPHLNKLPPHFETILSTLEAQCSPKKRKSFELHIPKKSSHCSPTLTLFWAEKFNPGCFLMRWVDGVGQNNMHELSWGEGVTIEK